MKKLKLLLSLVLMIFTHNCLYPQELTTQQIYEKCLPSVVTLKVLKTDGSTSIGSAALAIEDGLGITAWHVVKNASSVVAVFQNGEKYEVSGIKDKDEQRDICLIKIKAFGKPMLNINPTEPKVGEKVVIIGAPRGLEFSVSDGIISQIQIINGVKQFQFTCPASPGNSGSPLINAKGEIIGVVSWQVKEGQNLNFAVPSNYVFGLDKTLPTIPWQEVKSLSLSKENQLREDEKDIVLAKLANAINDIRPVVFCLNKTMLMKENGFKDPFPYFFYNIKEKLKSSIIDTKSFDFDDVKKEKARNGLLEYGENGHHCLELMEESIKTARNSGGWTSTASDLTSQAWAYFSKETNINFEELRNILKNSKVFLENLNLFARDNFEPPNEVWTQYRLGVEFIADEPDLILDVGKDTFAEEIGLEINDRLLKLNGKSVANTGELKNQFFENQGKEVVLLILRDQKEKSLEFEVPIDLIKKYGQK